MYLLDMNLQRRLSALILLYSVVISSGADPLPMEERAAIVDRLLCGVFLPLQEKVSVGEGIDSGMRIRRE